MRAAAALVLLLTATACGARTNLETRDAGSSATFDGAAHDAGRDTHVADDAFASPDSFAPDDAFASPDSSTCMPGADDTLPRHLFTPTRVRTTMLRTDIHILTPTWEPTPTVIQDEWTSITRAADEHLSVSGNPAGDGPWTVDNFLLFEVHDCTGARIDAALLGFTGGETVLLDGLTVRRIGAELFDYPGGVNVDTIAPAGQPVRVHVTALDYGEHVLLTDIYLSAI